ncbi:DUF1819 family protein [Galactobacillus timonensis]|uniref:DUF1819 family protein n=1 Tax=Galactobacillus timonensis TaxID=2041840 RepID=UPI000C82B91E|nr:DUF1819 family protein [Galactobacillus timonensis]
MKRNAYSAGAVKFAFWFQEFRKEVELLQEGKSFEEIKNLSSEGNLFGTQTPARSRLIYNTVTKRIKALGDDFYDLYLESDIATQKLFVLSSIMASDTLFFDFVYEVIREKMLIGSNTFTDADIRIFFHNKQVQDETAAKWTDQTLNRLGRTYKAYLCEAGITDNGKTERKILKPILDPSFEHWLSDHEMAPIVKALTGEA